MNIPAELQPIADAVIESKLPNGLKVRLIPSSTVPTISFYTFFHVGSRNERPGITGISHLFEHMMFNGSKKYGPGRFDGLLEGSGGSSNAYTANDITVYYESFMAEALELVIDLESDRMRALTVTPKMLERERQVVIEERRLRVENDIPGTLDEELGTLVWKAHPYRWPVIGWMKDIESISRDDCMDFFQTFYTPNNATLYLAGDFEPKAAMQLIKKYYGSIKPGKKPPPPVVDAEPEQKGERRAEVLMPAQAPSMLIAWRGPPASHEDTLALDVLQYALTVGHSSRLVRSLVFERELCLSVSIDWSWRIDPGAVVAALDFAPAADAKAAESALYAELERVQREGLTERELQKAKNNLTSRLLRELATNNGRAHALGYYEVLLGSWQEGLKLTARYEKVTAEQVQKVAQQYLTPVRRSVVSLQPQREAA